MNMDSCCEFVFTTYSEASPYSCSYHYVSVWWGRVTVAETLTVISICTQLLTGKMVTAYYINIFKAFAFT